MSLLDSCSFLTSKSVPWVNWASGAQMEAPQGLVLASYLRHCVCVCIQSVLHPNILLYLTGFLSVFLPLFLCFPGWFGKCWTTSCFWGILLQWPPFHSISYLFTSIIVHQPAYHNSLPCCYLSFLHLAENHWHLSIPSATSSPAL